MVLLTGEANMADKIQDKALLKRVVFASLIVATVEWYDFFLYGTFAGGFIARPLGGVIFGHFGDRIGRKSMLIMTLMIMGIATLLIGLVPTYDQIGVWAPIALLILRVLQGLGLGGEWGGAVLMTYEYAEPNKRGLYASLPQIGLSIGLCLASGIVAFLSFSLTDAQFLAWGWRIAFGLSFILVLVGLYIRLNIMETPEFAKVKQKGAEVKIPFMSMIKEYPKEVTAGMRARHRLFGETGILDLAAFTRADHSGRAALVVPFGIFYASIYGPEAALFCDLFKPEVRYTGISFVYQFFGIFSNGLTQIIATILVREFAPNGGWAVAGYCVFAGIVSALGAVWINRLARQRSEAGGTAAAALVA